MRGIAQCTAIDIPHLRYVDARRNEHLKFTFQTHSPGACIATLATGLPALARTPAYEIIDLGTLGGDASSALEINESGQVVGASLTVGAYPRRTRPSLAATERKIPISDSSAALPASPQASVRTEELLGHGKVPHQHRCGREVKFSPASPQKPSYWKRCGGFLRYTFFRCCDHDIAGEALETVGVRFGAINRRDSVQPLKISKETPGWT